MTDAMSLCTACRRHVFAPEPRCPFCAHALEPGRAIAADPGPGATRAQRYALGVALAAVATSACDHARPQPPLHQEISTTSLDVTLAAPEPDVAAPPSPAAALDAAVADVATTDVAEDHKPHPRAHPATFRWFHHINHPPYGCVFPHASCDVVSA